MLTHARKTAIIIGVSALTAACGAKLKGSKTSGGDDAPAAVDALVTVTTTDEAGLALLATTASFSGSIAGCITGHAAAFDQSSTSVGLLVGDTGCYARLNSVNVTFGDGSSAVYSPDSAYKFGAGTSVIVNAAGTEKVMKISVTSNLPAAIVASPAPQIAMNISFVDFGGSQTASVKAASAGIDIDVENTVPYQLSSVDLTVDGATGGGAFEFRMNCYDAVAGDDKCSGMTQTGLKSKMAVDTYLTNGQPRNLTIEECTALAGAGSAPGNTYAAADAEPTMPNGGVLFAHVGPSPLCAAANSKMVLAASHPDSASCKWWRVTIQCP